MPIKYNLYDNINTERHDFKVLILIDISLQVETTRRLRQSLAILLREKKAVLGNLVYNRSLLDLFRYPSFITDQYYTQNIHSNEDGDGFKIIIVKLSPLTMMAAKRERRQRTTGKY